MGRERHKATWPTEVPHADATLRESAARVTARNRWQWGYVLARLRLMAGQSLADQAAALGVSANALTFLAVARLPRAGQHNADLAATSALVGVEVELLRQLLANGCDVATVSGVAPNRR